MKGIWACQVALALTQTLFALGAVYYKYIVDNEDQMHKINPVVFAFTREAVAGTIMCLIASASGARPKRSDWPRLILLGTLLYCNQLFYILGVGLSGVVIATCMQPGIPVFTVALAVLLRREAPSTRKTLGILLASAGAICMIAGGGPGHGGQDTLNLMMGNSLLFLNVICMALYYILAKPFLAVYPPMAVAAWAYAAAAVNMGITAVMCNHAHPENWHLPTEIFGPLIYWIFVCSIAGYYIIAWSMTHLPASQVAAFQCLQPFVGTALGFVVLGERLTWWDLGAVAVIAGLFIVNNQQPLPPSASQKIKYMLPTISIKPVQISLHQRAKP